MRSGGERAQPSGLRAQPHRAPSPHLEPDAPLFTAQAGQHEDDDSEESRERHRHHSQGGRPGQLAEWGAVCRRREGLGVASAAQPPHCTQSPRGTQNQPDPHPLPGSPAPPRSTHCELQPPDTCSHSPHLEAQPLGPGQVDTQGHQKRPAVPWPATGRRSGLKRGHGLTSSPFREFTDTAL